MPLTNIKPRSDSAVVRNLLDDIEQAIDNGASRQEIYESIKAEHQLTLSFNGFCVALKRARKKRDASGSHDPQTIQRETGSYNPNEKVSGSHDPEAETNDPTPAPSPDEKPAEKKKAMPMKGGAFRPPKGFNANEFDTDKYGRRNDDE